MRSTSQIPGAERLAETRELESVGWGERTGRPVQETNRQKLEAKAVSRAKSRSKEFGNTGNQLKALGTVD
jgi:hypothetical protein